MGDVLTRLPFRVAKRFDELNDRSAFDGSTVGITPSVEFYNGNDDLITTLNAFGLVANYVVTGSNTSGVSKIVLPAGAFFDNMSDTGSAVPEPSAAILLVLASLGLVSCCHR